MESAAHLPELPLVVAAAAAPTIPPEVRAPALEASAAPLPWVEPTLHFLEAVEVAVAAMPYRMAVAVALARRLTGALPPTSTQAAAGEVIPQAVVAVQMDLPWQDPAVLGYTETVLLEQDWALSAMQPLQIPAVVGEVVVVAAWLTPGARVAQAGL